MQIRVHPWLVYLPLRNIFPRLWIDHWTPLTFTEPRIYISCFRVHPCSSVVNNISRLAPKGYWFGRKLSILSLIISPCFRVHPCSSVVGTPPPTRPVAFDTFPIHTRYIPDTYPIHTYIPWIPHEYPAYTPWIPHPKDHYERSGIFFPFGCSVHGGGSPCVPRICSYG